MVEIRKLHIILPQRDRLNVHRFQIDDSDRRRSGTVDCAGVQDESVSRHAKFGTVRVAVTDQVPLAGMDFVLKSFPLVTVEKKDFLATQLQLAKPIATGLLYGTNRFS